MLKDCFLWACALISCLVISSSTWLPQCAQRAVIWWAYATGHPHWAESQGRICRAITQVDSSGGAPLWRNNSWATLLCWGMRSAAVCASNHGGEREKRWTLCSEVESEPPDSPCCLQGHQFGLSHSYGWPAAPKSPGQCSLLFALSWVSRAWSSYGTNWYLSVNFHGWHLRISGRIMRIYPWFCQIWLGLGYPGFSALRDAGLKQYDFDYSFPKARFSIWVTEVPN